MEDLKITLVQPDIVWEDKQANLKRIAAMTDEVESTDVIVLPEMFSTGFSMNPAALSESMNGETVNWMKKLAVEKDAAVTGSLIIDDEGKMKNRAVWVNPRGSIMFYDKRHLFSMGEEDRHYTQGHEKLVVEFRGWKFCPLICYDLRFPVWSRNVEDYDVLIYMANWPSPRHHVWKILLAARAIENQCYCVGVNRTGTDGEERKYLGDSVVITPKGIPEYMGEIEDVQTFILSRSELDPFRATFPLLNDRDQFTIL